MDWMDGWMNATTVWRLFNDGAEERGGEGRAGGSMGRGKGSHLQHTSQHNISIQDTVLCSRIQS